MRVLKVIALLVPVLAIGAAAWADDPPPGFVGFWDIQSGPGNSWTASVHFYGTTTDMPTDYNIQIIPLPMANPPAIPYYWGDPGPAGWTDYYLGQSEYFETTPATVTQYGAAQPLAGVTETMFDPTLGPGLPDLPGAFAMEIHTPVHNNALSANQPEDTVTLPLALGYWTGWAQGVPSFVLQIQAYDANGVLLDSGSIMWDGLTANWDGESSDSSDAYVKSSGYYSSLGVQAMSDTAPLPEPITMFGVLAGVIGLARYARKHKTALL